MALLAQHFEVVSDCGGAPAVHDSPARALAMGEAHGCRVDDGVVRCWGANSRGELGRGTVSPFESRAATVALDEPVAQLATAAGASCARTVTGRVFCWGDNAASQLGRTAPAFSATPLEVKVPVPVAKVAMHSDFALALGSDGRLFGWGNDSEGTLGRGNDSPMTEVSPQPVLRAAFEHRFKDITAGQGHACGIDEADVLWCWGRNTSQELGTPSTEPQHRAPVKVLEEVSAVVAGAFGTCALRAGALLCWSDMPIDDQGQTLKATAPTKVDLGGQLVRQVDQQWFHLCAVTTSAQLFCWGRGIEGQLGLGAIDPQPAPREVATGIESVATGFFFTCLRRTDGVVACMGENNLGQLGLGDLNRRSLPTAQ
jgi:alpha-tubulin suppressor-like RCC1 family protein